MRRTESVGLLETTRMYMDFLGGLAADWIITVIWLDLYGRCHRINSNFPGSHPISYRVVFFRVSSEVSCHFMNAFDTFGIMNRCVVNCKRLSVVELMVDSRTSNVITIYPPNHIGIWIEDFFWILHRLCEGAALILHILAFVTFLYCPHLSLSILWIFSLVSYCKTLNGTRCIEWCININTNSADITGYPVNGLVRDLWSSNGSVCLLVERDIAWQCFDSYILRSWHKHAPTIQA